MLSLLKPGNDTTYGNQETKAQLIGSMQTPRDDFKNRLGGSNSNANSFKNQSEVTALYNSSSPLRDGPNFQNVNVSQFELNNSEKKKVQKAPLGFEPHGHSNKIKVAFGSLSTKPHDQSKKMNSVRTTKYTALSWAPLSLIFQFKRAANIYFLIISVLTCLSFSPKSAPSMIGTFAAVLIFTMLKEAYEDIQRYKSDKELNNRKAHVLQRNLASIPINTEATTISSAISHDFHDCQWRDVKVGDIVMIQKDTEFPADILLLHVAQTKDIAYVDTMNLDGETNLKEKQVFERDYTVQRIQQELANSFGEVVCDHPNESLEEWDGNIHFQGKVLNCKGCYLRNVDYCVGLVIYVGKESKIMMNAKKPPKKVSNIMQKMNHMLYTVFGFQLLLITVYASLSLLWKSQLNTDRTNLKYTAFLAQDYLQLSTQSIGLAWFIQLLTFWVAYSHLIPISLYVIIEMLKLSQAKIIGADVRMYDWETEQFALCRNSDLIEELGQVDFIFSDKTGTLTQNKMIFKKCSINNQIFGTPQSQDTLATEQMADSSIKQILQLISNQSKEKVGQQLSDFFTMLAVCHTCTVELDPKDHTQLKYQASSPDELALVQGASQVGIKFIARSTTIITIQHIDGKIENYEPLVEFPFDSTRKRMSLIVRQSETKKCFLMTKGADSIMMPRLKLDQQFQKGIESDLHKFAIEGLRTLVFSKRELSQKETEDFMTKYTSIKTSIDPNKEQQLLEMYDKMEYGLTYLGSSAIEDKLQEGVAETIENVMKANIRVWVLTGDKQETAIEIGKSCKLIQEGMIEIVLSSKSKEEFLAKLEKYSIQQYKERLAIIIDGQTLIYALDNDFIAQSFFIFGMRANSMICCRVSPKQKADVVALAKKQKKYICLSIGDGANDVSMILEAHIGVGIRGKEGTQAVRSADYAISQFRFLERLLMVHGRYGYMRVAKMICYYFYKNVVLVAAEIHFSYWNGFSGQIFFADWLSTLYNAFFTSWFCLFALMYERDVDDQMSLQQPILYMAGQKKVYFNFKIFWKWIILSFIHGGSCFYITVFLLGDSSISNTGRMYDHWLHSTIVFSIIIHLATYKLFLEINYWNVINIVAALVCFSIYYLTVILLSTEVFSTYFQDQMNGIFFQIYDGLYPIYVWVVLPFGLLIPDLGINFIQRVFWPTPQDSILHLFKNRNSQSKYMYPITINSQRENVDIKAVQKFIGRNQTMKFNIKDDHNSEPKFMQINVYSSQNISINDSQIVINSPNYVDAQIQKQSDLSKNNSTVVPSPRLYEGQVTQSGVGGGSMNNKQNLDIAGQNNNIINRNEQYNHKQIKENSDDQWANANNGSTNKQGISSIRNNASHKQQPNQQQQPERRQSKYKNEW